VSNVISLEQYRSERMDEEAAAKAAAQLSTMSYVDVLEWAGVDFGRLLAVARARDYRPEWIAHQLEERGRPPTQQQATVLDRMIADAGEYLSRRERWVLRQLKAKPMSESGLVKLATKAAEFRGYKHPGRCVANDIGKLAARNLIQARGGLVYYPVDHAGGSGGAAQASTPL
jgi:hypothetical protein